MPRKEHQLTRLGRIAGSLGVSNLPGSPRPRNGPPARVNIGLLTTRYFGRAPTLRSHLRGRRDGLGPVVPFRLGLADSDMHSR